MARRKDHTRDALTRMAIDAGRELVIADGPGALTARNVAKRIGYTPGTLYNLFENIDGLAAAINTTSLETFAETIRLILKNHTQPEKRLNRIAETYLHFHQTSPHLWNLLFATRIQHQSESYHNAIHRVFDQVTEAMLPLSETQEAARQDAKILWSTLHGICLLQDSDKLDVTKADPPETLAKRYLEHFFHCQRP